MALPAYKSLAEISHTPLPHHLLWCSDDACKIINILYPNLAPCSATSIILFQVPTRSRFVGGGYPTFEVMADFGDSLANF